MTLVSEPLFLGMELFDSTMAAAKETRHKEMLDQILIMVMKMASDLEACNTAFQAAHPAVVANSDNSDSASSALTVVPAASLTLSRTFTPLPKAPFTVNITPTFTCTGYNSTTLSSPPSTPTPLSRFQIQGR